MMPLSGFVIYVFARGKGRLSKALSTKWCVYLGEASYAFYLIHLSAIRVIEHGFDGDGPLVCLILSFALALAAAIAMFRWIEAPARTYLRMSLAAPASPTSQAFESLARPARYLYSN
jgi:peptidoglycan/LPS O-acetylase OafA/YrhL